MPQQKLLKIVHFKRPLVGYYVMLCYCTIYCVPRLMNNISTGYLLQLTRIDSQIYKPADNVDLVTGLVSLGTASQYTYLQ